MVGSAFARAAARRGHRVVGVTSAPRGQIEGVAQLIALDLADEAATTSAVLDAFPAAMVNCAAISIPQACEADPVRAQALNVALPANLARIAHHLSARLVHISSEQVFDGAQTQPYRRDTPLAPINLYGRQKVESERAVQAAAPEFAVTVRAPLMMGNSLGGRRSPHEGLFLDWVAGRTPRLYTDEFRQTCTAGNLAEVLLELCERTDFRGVLQWGGKELVSRYELGVRIREHFKLTEREAPIAAITRADTPDVARRRPACLALDLQPLAGRLKTQPQSLGDQLAELVIPPAARPWYATLAAP